MATMLDRPVKINGFTDEEIRQLERICCFRGCYNRSARGLIVCEECHYGTAERADDELVKLKKRYEKATRKGRK